MKFYRLLSLGISTFLASSVYAEVLCDSGQKNCYIKSKNYTIGDRVGIFNSDGDLVAAGEIKRMSGQNRAIKIDKRHGYIRRNHRFALLGHQGMEREQYRIYRNNADHSVGGSFGLASLAVGNQAPAYEFTGFSQWKGWRGLQWVARGTYLSADGSVSKTSDNGIESRSFDLTGIGALGGAAYTIRNSRTVGFRGELGLGLMWASAKVDGSSDLSNDEEYDVDVSNGLGAFGRGGVSAIWNLGAWHVNFEVAQLLIHQTTAVSFAGGIIKDIK